MDVATLGEMNRHLNERSLSLHLLRTEVVHRDDGCHLRVDGLSRAIRSSLEAIRAEGDRLAVDRRNTASHATTALDLPYGQGEQCWLS